jgi:hypothetical protein
MWLVSSGTPADWALIDPTVASVSLKDPGAGGVSTNLAAFRASENAIYFLDSAGTDLYKILCDSPFTITKLTSSAYNSTLNGTTAPTTIVNATTMEFTPDESALIFVRGGDVDDHPYIILVDRTDGSIDQAVSLPSPLANNYGVSYVVVLDDVLITMGDQRLQLINYQFPGTGSSSGAFTPPLFASRMSSTTTAIVEFWDPEKLPQKVKMDCGFHIEFARD